jgi:hypothetical protein
MLNLLKLLLPRSTQKYGNSKRRLYNASFIEVVVMAGAPREIVQSILICSYAPSWPVHLESECALVVNEISGMD